MNEKENNLYSIYYGTIYPQIEDIETYRRTLLNKVFVNIFLGLIISLIIVITCYFDRGLLSAVLLTPIIMFLITFIIVWGSPQLKLFSIKLKNDYFHTIIKIFAEIKLWQRNKEFSEVLPDIELLKSGLFRQFNRRKNDDEFRGVYKGVEFSVSESTLIMENGLTKPEIVFKGLIINFNSNKKIAQRTIIATREESSHTFLKAFLGFVLGFLTMLLKMEPGIESLALGIITGLIVALPIYFYSSLNLTKKESNSEIKLEDPNFSKHFNVFSEDDVEARYLLTPTFIEKFTKLKKIMKASLVKCSFYDNSIMIAVTSDKDFFELGNLYKNVGDISTIKNFYDDISIILELIDYFNLDTRIGL